MFHLPKLPYAFNALDPRLSEEALRLHYDGHHGAYVKNLNEMLVTEKRLSGRSLMGIMGLAEGALFNNAAQAWNHTFYWYSMTAEKGVLPSGTLDAAIRGSFRSMDGMRQTFLEAGTGLFGSGWLWLIVESNGTLSFETTQNADNPALKNKTPLMVCDLWEHAYYVDYRNKRLPYLEAFFDSIDWKFVSKNFELGRIPNMSALMGGAGDENA